MMKNIEKNQHRYVPLLLLEQIPAQWRHPVASSEALDLLCRVMYTVSYCCIAVAIKVASKVGVFFIIVLLIVALEAAGAILSKWLPDGGVQGQLVWPWICCIRQCHVHCFNMSTRPSKRPATEVHSFVAVDLFEEEQYWW